MGFLFGILCKPACLSPRATCAPWLAFHTPCFLKVKDNREVPEAGLSLMLQSPAVWEAGVKQRQQNLSAVAFICLLKELQPPQGTKRPVLQCPPMATQRGRDLTSRCNALQLLEMGRGRASRAKAASSSSSQLTTASSDQQYSSFLPYPA